MSSPHPRRWWILGVLIVGLLTVSLDNTILNVALPAIARALHATTSELEWMVDAYVLVFAGLLLTAGALGDRFGRRRVLLVGLFILGTASVASSLAVDPRQLIVMRAVMGFGAALVMPSTLSVLSSVFSPEERPKAIGIWTAVAGLGIVAGPVLAGWLLQHGDWNLVFVVNMPVVLLAIVGTLLIVPESRDDARGLDLGAGFLSVGGLASLVFAIIEAPSLGWSSPGILAALGAAAVLVAAFVAWELRSDRPMLDVRLFTKAQFAAAVLAVALASFGMFGSMFFLSQYMQVVLGFSTLDTGLRIVPLAVAMAVAAPASAVMAGRLGARVVVALGLGITAAGLLVLSTAAVGSGYGPVAAALALFGTGLGFAMTPVTTVMIAALPRGRAGIASAVNGTAREIGGALGVAILGSVASPIYASRIGPVADHLPTVAGSVVRESAAGAVAVAERLPAGLGGVVADAARGAFVAGMDSAVVVGAAVTLVGAALALAFLPGRVRQSARESAASSERTVGRTVGASADGPAAAAASEAAA